jgi:hypothetical protein
MKKILLCIMVLFFASCNFSTAESSHEINENLLRERVPTPLGKLGLQGNFYNGKQLKVKIERVINNSDIDSLSRKEILMDTEFFEENYNESDDEYGLIQTPSNFLFLELNNDNVEDMIFQSNGSFITDSYCFAICLSYDKNKYKWISSDGQIIGISKIEEYRARFDDEKERYLKIDYYKNGCCDDPWDLYETGLLCLENGRVSNEIRVIDLKAINSTRERLSRRNKK